MTSPAQAGRSWWPRRRRRSSGRRRRGSFRSCPGMSWEPSRGPGAGLHAIKTQQVLVAAVHDRRQLIAGLDRQAMLDVVRWGRRPVTINATKEQIAQEIARIRSMKFAGLSHRGLLVLARPARRRGDRGRPAAAGGPQAEKTGGIFQPAESQAAGSARGDGGHASSEKTFRRPTTSFCPSRATERQIRQSSDRPSPRPSKKRSRNPGLFGGISNRLKKSADVYLNQKLDEIENEDRPEAG